MKQKNLVKICVVASFVIFAIAVIVLTRSNNLVSDTLSFLSLFVSILTFGFALAIYDRYDILKSLKSEETQVVLRFISELRSIPFDIRLNGNNATFQHFGTSAKAFVSLKYAASERILNQKVLLSPKYVREYFKCRELIYHPYFPETIYDALPSIFTAISFPMKEENVEGKFEIVNRNKDTDPIKQHLKVEGIENFSDFISVWSHLFSVIEDYFTKNNIPVPRLIDSKKITPFTVEFTEQGIVNVVVNTHAEMLEHIKKREEKAEIAREYIQSFIDRGMLNIELEKKIFEVNRKQWNELTAEARTKFCGNMYSYWWKYSNTKEDQEIAVIDIESKERIGKYRPRVGFFEAK